MARDHVDGILEQWVRERPDLDVSAMGIIGRISRMERAIRPKLNAVFAEHGLESWEFDMLATLRRSGEPFRLTAGQLIDSMMVTSGTMTNRIDRIEQRGLVERTSDPNDGRVVLVTLTMLGKQVVDAAVADHAANEAAIVSVLSERDQQHLAAILRRFHLALTDH